MPRKSDQRSIKELVLEIQAISSRWVARDDYEASELVILKNQVQMARGAFSRLTKVLQTDLEKKVLEDKKSENAFDKIIDQLTKEGG